MRKLLMTITAVALVLPAAAGSALGQETRPELVAQTREAPAVPEDAVASRITLESVVEWIETARAVARRLSTVERLKTIDVARIGDGAGEAVTGRIDAAVSDNKSQVTELRQTIRQFGPLASRLEAVGLDVDDVVAARLSRRGDLLLFLRG